MAKISKKPAVDRAATATADANAANAAAAAATQLVESLVANIATMQGNLKSAMDDLVKTTSSAQQTSQLGSITEKLDVGSDESQSSGLALDSGNKRTLDNYIIAQMVRFADRDRTHFDNMQTLMSLAVSNNVFATSLCQNLATVDAHQQCGRSAVWREHK